MKKITGKHRKVVVTGRDVYMEASHTEITEMSIDADGDVNVGNHIHVTQVIEGEESQTDLEGKLVDSLNSRVFLPDARINNRIRIYRLEQSLTPGYESLDLSLAGKVGRLQRVREESKLSIEGILPYDGIIYTFAERLHSNREKEYRIFENDIDTKKTIRVSKPITGGPGFRLGIPTFTDRRFIIPQNDGADSAICEYKRGELHPVRRTKGDVEIAWPFGGTYVMMTADSVRIGKDLVYTVPDYFTGYTHLSEDLLFMSTKDHLVALDLKTGNHANYASWFSLNDVVENGGIHMLTGDESGIVYSHFETKEHTIQRKPERMIYMNSRHFKNLDRAYIQDPHVLLALRNPDTLLAVYHEDGRYQHREIPASQFDSLRGEVQKDVI